MVRRGDSTGEGASQPDEELMSTAACEASDNVKGMGFAKGAATRKPLFSARTKPSTRRCSVTSGAGPDEDLRRTSNASRLPRNGECFITANRKVVVSRRSVPRCADVFLRGQPVRVWMRSQQARPVGRAEKGYAGWAGRQAEQELLCTADAVLA